ncbi:hypothetical protein HNR01_004402 [Methylorubrum rhodesianum]|nr:hypothetical protein [Methylorubrum rhodesianum]
MQCKFGLSLMCRATDVEGRTQPLEGLRNEVHRVAITVPSEV